MENLAYDKSKEHDVSAEDVNSVEMHAYQPTANVRPSVPPPKPPSRTNKIAEKITDISQRFYDQNRALIRAFIWCTLAVLWLAFLIAGCVLNFNKTFPLLIITIVAIVGLVYFLLISPFITKQMDKKENVERMQGWKKHMEACWDKGLVKTIVILAVLIGIAVWLVIDTSDNRYRLLSAAGLLVYIFIAVLCSKHPLSIRWRPVIWGLLLQFAFALLILRWTGGQLFFSFIADQVNAFADYTYAGSGFVYGSLVTGIDYCVEGQPLMRGVFAFKVLMTIVLFSSTIAVLYHLGVLQFVIVRVALVMQYTMGTTAAESLSAAGNIAVGQTEAPLLVKPYLHKMTNSELHAIMTGGFATIAGTVFKIYVTFGACGSHLLSASVMSAPAALAVSKIVYPETKESKTKKIEDLNLDRGEYSSVLHAAAGGATNGIFLVLNICANLIAFLALLECFNTVLSFLGECVNIPGLKLEVICGYVFYPLAYLMGPGDGPEDQAKLLAELMGVKTFVNEFVAYQRMGELIQANRLTKRARLLATYALCGFSNLAAIGVQLGGIGAMCPARLGDLAKVAVRALIAGSIACFLTACVAGILTTEIVECTLPSSGGNCTVNLAVL